MNETTKTLMTHVEKIVRPIRATESRKLKMRRELLTHLTAALEEECAAGGTESEAPERAKRRIGEPAALTQQLQAAVPSTERVLLAKLPAPAILNRWEERTGKNWAVLATVQAALQAATLAATAIIISMIARRLAISIPIVPHQALIGMDADDDARYVLAGFGAMLFLCAMPLLVVAFLSKLRRGRLLTPNIVVLAAITVVIEMLWMQLLNTQILWQSIGPAMFDYGLVGGILLIMMYGATDIVLRRMDKHSREWRELDLAG